jgi:hypothetical protein
MRATLACILQNCGFCDIQQTAYEKLHGNASTAGRDPVKKLLEFFFQCQQGCKCNLADAHERKWGNDGAKKTSTQSSNGLPRKQRTEACRS